MIRTALVSVLCVLAILVVMPQVTQAKDSLYEQKMARGVLAFESGKFTEAAGEFQAALSEKPDDPAATLYLGIAQSRSGDPQAEATLKKAVGLNPKDARANFELGVLYYQRNIPEEANDYFDTAVSLSPGSEIAARSQEFKKAAGEENGSEGQALVALPRPAGGVRLQRDPRTRRRVAAAGDLQEIRLSRGGVARRPLPVPVRSEGEPVRRIRVLP